MSVAEAQGSWVGANASFQTVLTRANSFSSAKAASLGRREAPGDGCGVIVQRTMAARG